MRPKAWLLDVNLGEIATTAGVWTVSVSAAMWLLRKITGDVCTADQEEGLDHRGRQLPHLKMLQTQCLETQPAALQIQKLICNLPEGLTFVFPVFLWARLSLNYLIAYIIWGPDLVEAHLQHGRLTDGVLKFSPACVTVRLRDC